MTISREETTMLSWWILKELLYICCALTNTARRDGVTDEMDSRHHPVLSHVTSSKLLLRFVLLLEVTWCSRPVIYIFTMTFLPGSVAAFRTNGGTKRLPFTRASRPCQQTQSDISAVWKHSLLGVDFCV